MMNNTRRYERYAEIKLGNLPVAEEEIVDHQTQHHAVVEGHHLLAVWV